MLQAKDYYTAKPTPTPPDTAGNEFIQLWITVPKTNKWDDLLNHLQQKHNTQKGWRPKMV